VPIVAFAMVAMYIGSSAALAFQRDQIDAGFQLDQLIALAGTGGDPGSRNPRARLDWAVATAIPLDWRQLVPVVWSIGEVSPGSLALTFYDGTTIVSPRLLRRSSEELLATIAHEMGHQIAISLVPANDGSPPRGFVEFVPGNPYNRFDEGWADCVSRVWTGSSIHTSSESASCSVDAARYVASLLSDPLNVQRERLPLPSPVPSPTLEAPSPSPIPTEAPSPEPEKPQIARERSDAGDRDPIRLIVIGAVLLFFGPLALVALVNALVPDEERT
jgi:hypothetical protein